MVSMERCHHSVQLKRITGSIAATVNSIEELLSTDSRFYFIPAGE